MTREGAAPVSVSPPWRLFEDWCAATGLPSIPSSAATLAAFLAEVPAKPSTQLKRVQAIRRAHTDAGHELPLPLPEPLRPWRHGKGWLDLHAVLARTPTTGWPGGLAGRRDGFVAVLAGMCDMSREEIRRVGVADIHQDKAGEWSINDRQLAPAIAAAECPACAVARWLHVLDLWDGWGRASVREYVSGARVSTDHACLEPSNHGGLMVHTLLPGIDRYGWLADWEPLSARSISAILAYRQDAARQPIISPSVRPREDEGEIREDYQRASMAELTELLDLLDVKAAAALKETSAAIEGTAAMLDKRR